MRLSCLRGVASKMQRGTASLLSVLLVVHQTLNVARIVIEDADVVHIMN